jgi:hypothetical protein
LQIQPESFGTILSSIGFRPAQRLGEPGEGRKCPHELTASTVIDELAGFRRPVDLYVKQT